MTAGRLEAMKKAIVGLCMTVEEVEGSFKLNQHKSDADFAAVAGALALRPDSGSQEIARLDARSAATGLCQRDEQARKEHAMTLSDTKRSSDTRRRHQARRVR